MSKFIPRTTAPSRDNVFYYANNIFYKCGYGMPNCTAFAWGRMYELTGKYPTLCTRNAENWFNATYDGYARGKTPKLGAIAVWSKGKIGVSTDGAGHVASVEGIDPDGTINTGNSAHLGTLFYMKKIRPPYQLAGYNFEGFIYCPIDFDNNPSPAPVPTPTPTKEWPKYYTIKAGDTLSGIARKYYGNGDAAHYNFIAKANNIANPNLIVNGKTLTIPQYTSPSPTPTPAPSGYKFNPGDRVKIVGTGKASADGANPTAGGIGWERQILKRHDGKAYPYQVGNSTGTTGFYKESALKKI